MTALVDWDYWLNVWPAEPVACSRANAADGYPRPLTPLSQDLVLRYEERAVRRLYVEGLHLLRPDDAPQPYWYAFYGLIHVNTDQCAALGDVLPGSSPQALYQQFLGLEPDPNFTRPPLSLALRLRRARTGPPVAIRMIRLARELPTLISGEVDRIRATRPTEPLDRLTESDLASWLRHLDARQTDAWYPLVLAASVASAFYEIVRRALRAWAGDDNGDLTNRLHVDLGGNESTEVARALRRLAGLARNEGVTAMLAEPDAADRLLRSGTHFATAFAEVLRRYGHRGPSEFELAQPTWRLDPTPLLDTVALEAARLEAPEENGAAIRADAERALEERLNPIQRRIVGWALRRSRAVLPLRENGKIPATVLWDELRRLLDVAGRRLADRGVLSDPLHVVHLRHDELHACLDGGFGPGADEIERRRDAYRRCWTLDLPELVQAGPGGLRTLDDAYLLARGVRPPMRDTTVSTLQGIAAAPGVAVGTARVLSDPFDEFLPGDILFARTVDPGWAPVLSCAGGIVLDSGGVLSHGAVVARELAIPCVVNVKLGTQAIRTGTPVRIDGSSGTVEIDPEEG